MRDLLELLSLDDVKASLSAELASSRRLLPASSHYHGLRNKPAEASEWLHGLLSTNWQPSRERIVAASKARHGVRPIAVWDLLSSVVYRALTDRLASHLPTPVRSSAAWKAFQEEPLQRPGRYIVSADTLCVKVA